MFTGIVEEVGRVQSAVTHDGLLTLDVTAQRVTASLPIGGSVAVNGCCLTATAADPAGFDTEAMNQTLAVTALGELEAGARVNLELAMRASDRLGGHIVQGHVDGVATVLEAREDGFARRLRVGLSQPLLRHAIDKGSIALNGVSLTVAELGPEWVEVSLIPETLERTTLGALEAGSKLNVESDMVAKYVERLLSPFAGKDQP